MRGHGHRAFVDELARFAATAADARVTAIAERAGAPLRVAVRGRPGVGCSTVARALNRAGVSAEGAAQTEKDLQDRNAEAEVYVLTEVVKPEDDHAIRQAERPVLAVLNKADLTGFAGFAELGPISAARTQCRRLSRLVGVPTEPMMGLLAVAALDELDNHHSAELWRALRVLAAEPGSGACLDALYAGSFEDFLAAESSVPTQVRLRLLNSLDLFGIALAVAAVRQGRSPAQVRFLLRQVSRVDAVVEAITVVAVQARYRRVLTALAGLEALAVTRREHGERIWAFLAANDTVLATMAAAVEVVEAETTPARSEVQRSCDAAIARGSLRLRSRTAAERS